jgi:hypothetical protein
MQTLGTWVPVSHASEAFFTFRNYREQVNKVWEAWPRQRLSSWRFIHVWGNQKETITTNPTTKPQSVALSYFIFFIIDSNYKPDMSSEII